MIIPTCQTLAPSQVIPTLKRNLVQRNSVSRQGIAILGLAWPGLALNLGANASTEALLQTSQSKRNWAGCHLTDRGSLGYTLGPLLRLPIIFKPQ